MYYIKTQNAKIAKFSYLKVTYQGKQNGSVLSTNEQCTEQLEQAQIFPIQNAWAAQQILAKTILTFECGDGETIYMFHLHNLPSSTIL